MSTPSPFQSPESGVQPAPAGKTSTAELSGKQLDQVAGGMVIREKVEPPVK